MKVVLMVALTLVAGCAGTPPRPAAKTMAPARTAVVCSSETRTGSHVTTNRCITPEQAQRRHEESMRAMRAARQAKPAGTVAGQN